MRLFPFAERKANLEEDGPPLKRATDFVVEKGRYDPFFVIPAKAGIQRAAVRGSGFVWIPAFAE
jgi:hypothetical protein